MAQTSNGSITITDLTDITDVYLEYCMAADSITTAAAIAAKTTWTSPERGWSTEYPTWQSGYQIWIREVTEREGITEKEYGTPYLDKAVNQINTNLTNLRTRVKKIWSDSTGSYMASGIGGNDVTENNVSTYGFNSKSTTTGVSFNYNAISLTSLGTDGLKLYSPILTNSVITGNRFRATVNADGLIVYDGNGVASSNIQARFGDTATIGKTSGKNYNINITNSAIDLRYNTSILNRINSDGMTLYDGDGVAENNQIASFGETITIGKYQGNGAGALEITNKKISLGVTTRGDDGSFIIDNDATISPAVTIGYNGDKYENNTWEWYGRYVYIDPREIRMRMGCDVCNREITPFRAVASSFLTQSEGQSYVAKTIYLNGEQGLGAGETTEFILEFVGFEPSIGVEFDVNGNKIVSGSTITRLSQSGDYSTYRLTIPSTYSGANIYKIYVYYMISSVLPSVVVGGRPDRTEWDVTAEELEDDFYVGEYCLPGWLPYPFVVGTGNARTEREAGVDGVGGYGQGVNGFVVDWHGNINSAGSYYGVTPWANYGAGAPNLKSVSNRTWYWVTSFSGYVASAKTNDTNVFDKVNAGLKIKRDGAYLVSLWIHFNGTSGDRLYARVARCVGGDISNIGASTSSTYVALNPTWGEVHIQQMIACLENDTLCPQVARDASPTAAGGSFRFGSLQMNVTYLGSNAKLVDL